MNEMNDEKKKRVENKLDKFSAEIEAISEKHGIKSILCFSDI